MRIGLIFPGQGSQHPGMGTPWRDTESWWVAERASHISGLDVPELLCTADSDVLRQTANAQLSTLVVSLMALDYMYARGILNPNEITGCAGHSLGEYSALVAAKAISLDHAVALVAARGAAMQRAAFSEPGSMAAIVGLPRETLDELLAEVDGCWLANDNGSGQFVVSGYENPVLNVAERARSAAARLVSVLPVSGAFHSPLMRSASDALSEALAHTKFVGPAHPVLSNVTAEYYSFDDFHSLLIEQLIRPVRWRECIAALAQRCDMLMEVGPGKVLTRLARRDFSELKRVTINVPDDAAMIERPERILR